MTECPVQTALTDKCPIDHSSRSKWSDFARPYSSSAASSSAQVLSSERETSSIPRATISSSPSISEHWVYPSEAQFFAAMARKNHDPKATDMKTIVPIHNAVNERAWAELLRWETGRGGEQCGGVKLVTFKGNVGQMSPKARLKTFMGYSAPFDRHDWVVDRCGTKMRYVIDFYTGHTADKGGNSLSFYLDVRPALDSWEAVKMRANMAWKSWFS